MSSDISIDQFRFLERLLLVHGHLCYRRISSMICYFFYKNIAFGLTLFLYDAYTSFSEQAAYNDWINTFFNVFFMSLPVIALGVFDQDVSACFCLKPQRSPKDFCFMVSSPEEAFQWISGFANQQCFVKSAPHPMDKKHSSELLSSVPFYYDQMLVNCKSPPRVLVILNPRSGHGRSTKDFHGKVEPIFKLAGFKMEVVKTTSAGYAKKLASTVDFSTCPDGIICVGGDGIVNEVGRVRAVVSEGVKEIWLSNEDTGAYGRDIGTSLPHLLNAIVAELPPDRSTMLRIGMTNPPYIVEHLEEIAKALCHPSVYSFLHVPVQSGSDSVLQGKVQGEKNQWRVS